MAHVCQLILCKKNMYHKHFCHQNVCVCVVCVCMHACVCVCVWGGGGGGGVEQSDVGPYHLQYRLSKYVSR